MDGVKRESIDLRVRRFSFNSQARRNKTLSYYLKNFSCASPLVSQFIANLINEEDEASTRQHDEAEAAVSPKRVGAPAPSTELAAAPAKREKILIVNKSDLSKASNKALGKN